MINSYKALKNYKKDYKIKKNGKPTIKVGFYYEKFYQKNNIRIYGGSY